MFLLDNVWRLLCRVDDWCTPIAAAQRRVLLRRCGHRFAGHGGDIQATLSAQPELLSKLRALWKPAPRRELDVASLSS